MARSVERRAAHPGQQRRQRDLRPARCVAACPHEQHEHGNRHQHDEHQQRRPRVRRTAGRSSECAPTRRTWCEARSGQGLAISVTQSPTKSERGIAVARRAAPHERPSANASTCDEPPAGLIDQRAIERDGILLARASIAGGAETPQRVRIGSSWRVASVRPCRCSSPVSDRPRRRGRREQHALPTRPAGAHLDLTDRAPSPSGRRCICATGRPSASAPAIRSAAGRAARQLGRPALCASRRS